MKWLIFCERVCDFTHSGFYGLLRFILRITSGGAWYYCCARDLSELSYMQCKHFNSILFHFPPKIWLLWIKINIFLLKNNDKNSNTGMLISFGMRTEYNTFLYLLLENCWRLPKPFFLSKFAIFICSSVFHSYIFILLLIKKKS